jgi:MFS superfamily sulfate permease-like transporter
VTGNIPSGLPSFAMPTFGLLEFDELFPLAAGVLLLAYIEGVSAARSFAAKHGYALDVRQEFFANFAASLRHGYPVAGGLPQSAVNDQAGAKTPLALVICSITLAICLLFLTGLLTNLPKAVLAAIVFIAVYKLVDVAGLVRMWWISRIDFFAAAIALVSVLLLGILQGILLAALASIFLLLARASQPNVAFLGRVPGTGRYADSARNPDVEPLAGVIAFRPEASLLYINAETVLDTVGKGRRGAGDQDCRLRSLVFAFHRSGGRQDAARPPWRTCLARDRFPRRRRSRAGPRCSAGRWFG